MPLAVRKRGVHECTGLCILVAVIVKRDDELQGTIFHAERKHWTVLVGRNHIEDVAVAEVLAPEADGHVPGVDNGFGYYE